VSVLIDSDILIEVARARNAALLTHWRKLADSEEVLLCSPVTVAELWHGARPAEHIILNALFSTLLCTPVDRETGRVAGDFLRTYRKSHGVELGDALIAAGAHLHDAELWTRNRKHYPMPGLRFFEPGNPVG
jgi:predicted nucleic acid-binding protein